jgi:hypothetical protein
VEVRDGGNGKWEGGLMDSSIEKPILPDKVLFGLPGRIVKTLDPYTEADPVAVLVSLHVMFGNIIGRNPHFLVEKTQQHTNIFAGVVGSTSTGRKGQSLSTPRYIFNNIESVWSNGRILSGMTSGEGLIYQIRDQNGDDLGESDKRLLLCEEEFAFALQAMKRDGNTLSPVLRQAWDSTTLSPLTKRDRIMATDPHVSIIAHITPEELIKNLGEIEWANGFGNRFLWFYVRKSKDLPFSDGMPESMLQPLVKQVMEAVLGAKSINRMTFSKKSKKLWKETYPELTNERSGFFGALSGRAAPQVLRLTMIYALWDKSSVIHQPHLEAALALWAYSEESIKLIFGDKTGDPEVDQVAKCVRVFKRVSRSQVYDWVGHRNNQKRIDEIWEKVQALGVARSVTENGTKYLVTIQQASSAA